jgi:hypothetical protein
LWILDQYLQIKLIEQVLTEFAKEKNVDMLHSLLGKKNVDVSRSQSFIIMNLKPLIELVKEKKKILGALYDRLACARSGPLGSAISTHSTSTAFFLTPPRKVPTCLQEPKLDLR